MFFGPLYASLVATARVCLFVFTVTGLALWCDSSFGRGEGPSNRAITVNITVKGQLVDNFNLNGTQKSTFLVTANANCKPHQTWDDSP